MPCFRYKKIDNLTLSCCAVEDSSFVICSSAMEGKEVSGSVSAFCCAEGMNKADNVVAADKGEKTISTPPSTAIYKLCSEALAPSKTCLLHFLYEYEYYAHGFGSVL